MTNTMIKTNEMSMVELEALHRQLALTIANKQISYHQEMIANIKQNLKIAPNILGSTNGVIYNRPKPKTKYYKSVAKLPNVMPIPKLENSLIARVYCEPNEFITLVVNNDEKYNEVKNHEFVFSSSNIAGKYQQFTLCSIDGKQLVKGDNFSLVTRFTKYPKGTHNTMFNDVENNRIIFVD